MSATSSAEISSDDLDAALAMGEELLEEEADAARPSSPPARTTGAGHSTGAVSATGTIAAPEASFTAEKTVAFEDEATAAYEDDVRSGMHFAPLHQEVILAPESESSFWEGLEGELGVFIATFAEGFTEGQELRLLITVSDGRAVLGPFEARARVVFLRAASDRGWPGAGLVLLTADDGLRAAAGHAAGRGRRRGRREHGRTLLLAPACGAAGRQR